MPSGGSAKPIGLRQPGASQLGAVIYEARLPWWLRAALTAILLPLVVVSAAILIRRWVDLDWIAWAAFLFCSLVLPFAIAEALVRRVRFYDHGLVVRNWVSSTRVVPYNDVTSVERDQSLRIRLSEGAAINIPKWEGDFDLIEDILKSRATGATGQLGSEPN